METEQDMKELYQSVYKQIPRYNNYSPAEQIAGLILFILREKNVHAIIDFGCGKGQLVQVLEKGGYNVRGVDITLDGLRDDVNSRICVEAPLSDMPFGNNEFDFGICVDVLEHIPESLLSKSLDEMARVTNGMTIFQVSTCKDCFGKHLAEPEPLHKSIHPKDVWLNKLLRHYAHVVPVETHASNEIFFCYNKEE